MTDNENRGITSFRDYGELWNFNVQKIEEIQGRVEASLRELEGTYAGFESVYADIMEQLDILSSIYAGYNTLQGSEYVMRLKSVLNSFHKRYTRDGMNFDLVHFLLERIRDARDSSFEDFPHLSHLPEPVTVAPADAPGPDPELKRFRWVTFERNHSWFISPYEHIEIRELPDATITQGESPDILTVEIGDTKLVVRDIFCRPWVHAPRPRLFILVDKARKNYAANRVGKRIYADHDFIAPLTEPFRTAGANALSPGRVRLFGTRHVILY